MDMNGFVNIVGLLAMVITWLIVSPLKESIAALRISVEKLTSSLEILSCDLVAIRERVASGEATIESNTKRIIHLEEVVEKTCKDCEHNRGV